MRLQSLGKSEIQAGVLQSGAEVRIRGEHGSLPSESERRLEPFRRRTLLAQLLQSAEGLPGPRAQESVSAKCARARGGLPPKKEPTVEFHWCGCHRRWR